MLGIAYNPPPAARKYIRKSVEDLEANRVLEEIVYLTLNLERRSLTLPIGRVDLRYYLLPF